MKRTPLSLIAHWADGELHGDDVAIDAVSNDTRALQPGCLYVALRGERFDGHEYLAQAGERGACAAVVAVAVRGAASPPPVTVTVLRISPSTPGAANSVTRA